MKEHAEHEEAGTLRTKSRVENDEHEGPRMESWHAALQAKSAIRLAAITVNQKSRLAALCHKPALLHIKQIGTH